MEILFSVRIININPSNKRREGMIVDIIEHKRKTIVGRFFKEANLGFVAPDNKRITQNIVIPPEEQLDAQSGQMVMAEIMVQPTIRAQPIGRIIEILGDYMAPGMEIEVAIHDYGLPHEWSEEVLTEVKNLASDISEQTMQKPC